MLQLRDSSSLILLWLRTLTTQLLSVWWFPQPSLSTESSSETLLEGVNFPRWMEMGDLARSVLRSRDRFLNGTRDRCHCWTLAHPWLPARQEPPTGKATILEGFPLCVTNDHKPGGLTQCPVIISLFCGSEFPGGSAGFSAKAHRGPR